MQGEWTDAELVILHEGVKNGLSARCMANVLGRTRNAVIGKIARLKIKDRKVKTINGGYNKYKKKSSEGGFMPPLGSGCQWDCGGEWCGKPTLPSRAYCQAHFDLAYVKPTPKLGVEKLVKLSLRN